MEQGTRAVAAAGPLGGLLNTWISILRDPGSFFASIREPNRLGPPFAFAYSMVFLCWVLNLTLSALSLLSTTPEKLPRYAVFLAVQMAQLPLGAGFLGGLMVWGIARNYGAPDATYKSAVGICCYSLAIMPIAAVVGFLTGHISPKLGGGQIVFLYGFYIVARGLIGMHRTRPGYTYVLFGLIALLVQGMGYYAYQRAADGMKDEARQSQPAASAGQQHL